MSKEDEDASQSGLSTSMSTTWIIHPNIISRVRGEAASLAREVSQQDGRAPKPQGGPRLQVSDSTEANTTLAITDGVKPYTLTSANTH